MSDRYIEKVFICLLLISLLLHAGIIALIVFFPEKPKHAVPQPYMVELRDLPLPQQPPRVTPTRPKEEAERKIAPPPVKQVAPPVPAPLMPPPSATAPTPAEAAKGVKGAEPRKRTAPSQLPAGESLVRPKPEKGPGIVKLFPSGQSLASIEDGYRRKYEDEVGGSKVFLDENNDILGSYSRRFLEALRGNWQLVGRKMLSNTDIGYGLLLITISRDGTVTDVQVVESSGGKKVDSGIIQAVRTMSYVGPLPKNWPHDRLQGYYIYSAGYDLR
jgi:protein TonB